MDQAFEIFAEYEAITDSQWETIRIQQDLIKQLTEENINLKQMIYEAV